MKKIDWFDKFWRLIHIRNLIIAFCIGMILLWVNEIIWPESFSNFQHIIKEFIIVFIAAFAVSAYFEFFLRKGIYAENMKMFELREELGRAGILKYFANFKDLDLRSYFHGNVKFVDIYVNFGDTVFNQINDELYKFCTKDENRLNIYMLSPRNRFISGLGALWGNKDEKYNEDGIKAKIKSAQQTIISVFEQLKKENKLKAVVNVYSLVRNPVFYSFYRFDDTIIYVPSKIVDLRTMVPPAFQLFNTHNPNDLFNKCRRELEIIHSDLDGNLEVTYSSSNG